MATRPTSCAPAPEELNAVLAAYQSAITPAMREAAGKSTAVARQFLPDIRELEIAAYEIMDPIGDNPHSPLPHLVHRYPNRVLWKIAPACAVYCRFCFRKEHIGKHGTHPSDADIAAAHSYLHANCGIEEVILSGGDPMTLSPVRLRQFTASLADIAHIQRIRVHTRVPIVQPAETVLQWHQALLETGKPLTYVLHINHADELSPAADRLIAALRQDAMLLSQTVLLKGVNDSRTTLKILTDALLARRIHPYYLHHLDPARGTSHFRLTLTEGAELYRAYRAITSGIAHFTYIVEIPGGGGKIPVLELTDAQRQHLHTFGIS